MRLEALERSSEGVAGPLHRVEPRLKLVATLAYVVGVVLTPPGAWRVLAAEGLVLAFAIGLSGVPPRDLIRRWLGFLALVGFLAAMVAPGHPDRARLGLPAVASAIIAKNSMAFLAMMTLVHVTPFRVLLASMGRLGLPPLMVSTLQFMERQIHILSDELGRMVQARRSRTFRRHDRLGFSTLTGLIGMLFLRSFERGERVHAAMLARGWDGTVRTLDGPDDR
ncbi:energy-coupling factor transporter transmembrane component T family protein [Tundrisphaera lichenicola]|uniref:energy-coupling factor transporter transmembrane component T family protein n=1 Tax=Tundrisphaera lichenicola TaxID=2029860 RepID=UPI003EBF232D